MFSKEFFMVLLISAVIVFLINVVVAIMKIREALTNKVLSAIDWIFGMLGLALWNNYARDIISEKVFYIGIVALILIILSGCAHVILYIFSADANR